MIEMELESCMNIMGMQVLQYAEKAHDLLCWAALSESPLLMHAKCKALDTIETPLVLENGTDTSG